MKLLIISAFLVCLSFSAPISWRESGTVHIQHCINSQIFHPFPVARHRSRVSLSNPSGNSFGGWIEYEIGDMRMFAISNRFGRFFMSFTSSNALSLISGNPPTGTKVDFSDRRLFVRKSVTKRAHRSEVLFHPPTQKYLHVDRHDRPRLTAELELATPICYL